MIELFLVPYKTNLKTRLDKEKQEVTAQLQQTEQELNAQLAHKVSKKKTETRFSLGGSKLANTKLFRNITYNAPSNFNWQDHPLRNRIFTDGNGNFDTDFDVSELAPTGKKYYVSLNGDNENDGLTSETALKSIYAALQKTDVKEIIMASGYYGDDSFNNAAITKSVSIKAAEGADVTVSSTRLGLPWTKTDGQTNVYQTTRSLIGAVYDKSETDSDGDWLKLDLKGSITEVNGSPNSYFIDGSIVYVHTNDSRPADADIIPFMRVNNIKLESDVTVYLENINIEGGNYPVYLRNTDSSSVTFLAKNCTFKYSLETASDGVSNYGCTSILQDCIAAKNLDDGISYTDYGSQPTLGMEINCIGRHNGISGGNDNGTTAHDGANVIRINGAYYQNRGPSLADVGGSHSWNLGCLIAEAHGTIDQASNRGSVSSGNNGVVGTKVWLDGCTLYGSTPDIHTYVDNHTYVRNTNYITSNELEVAY